MEQDRISRHKLRRELRIGDNFLGADLSARRILSEILSAVCFKLRAVIRLDLPHLYITGAELRESNPLIRNSRGLTTRQQERPAFSC